MPAIGLMFDVQYSFHLMVANLLKFDFGDMKLSQVNEISS